MEALCISAALEMDAARQPRDQRHVNRDADSRRGLHLCPHYVWCEDRRQSARLYRGGRSVWLDDVDIRIADRGIRQDTAGRTGLVDTGNASDGDAERRLDPERSVSPLAAECDPAGSGAMGNGRIGRDELAGSWLAGSGTAGVYTGCVCGTVWDYCGGPVSMGSR